MVRPRRFLPALLGLSGLTVGLALNSAVLPASAATDSRHSQAPVLPTVRSALPAAVPAEPDTAPLRVRIAKLSKSSLPASGTLRIRGSVTNTSDETWTTIKLYSFFGDSLAPMSDPAALDAAMDVAFDAQVGERLVTVGTPGLIEVLEPGETASYVVTVPTDALDDALRVSTDDPADPGAYWFGVHALGQGGSLPRDNSADGRARTFLPYVPRRTEAVPASLVLPLTHAVLFDADGSVSDEERWTQRLSPGGRLRDLLTLGLTGAEAGVPITWLVDPALLDAIGLMAAGNGPRSLASTPRRPSDEPTGSGSTDAPQSSEAPTTDPDEPVESPEGTEGTDDESPADSEVALAAQGWLAAAAEVFAAGEVVALPYGNPDVTTTQDEAPALLDLSLAQSSSVLSDLDIAPDPIFAAPGGYVDAALAEVTPQGTPLLVSDRFLRSPGPSVVRLGGDRLIVTSSGAAEGSPGPGRSVTAVGLRQRVLAEAAVRALPQDPTTGPSTGPTPAGAATRAVNDATDPADPADPPGHTPVSASGQPLVVLLPTAWDLSTAEELFDGLDRSWVSFGPLSAATATTPAEVLGVDDLVDTTDVLRREVDQETFDAVQDLIDTADTLQRVLVGNTGIAARVTEQALSGLSYSIRRQQRVTRGSLALSKQWLDEQLGSIQITSSSGVTLSGDSGTFVVTLTNDLDQPVLVSIAATSDSGLVIDPVEPLELGAQSRTSVLLTVATETSRVHNVSLMVTDSAGKPLGASDQLAIRSVLVSNVIWLIIGVGVGTLFIAIGLRLRRRIVAARRTDPDPA